MDVQRILHMNGGVGQTSYVNNSSLQRTAISKAKCMVKDSILDLYCSKFSKNLSMADLGCSSGPNTLLVVTEIIEAIDEKCRRLKRRSPDFLVYLNDLPANDFNTIFKSLPSFSQTLKDNKGLDCFIAGVPGSFYQRLFPANFIDFFHSSYSVHWLSQVPQGLRSEKGVPINKGNVYMAKSSPPAVFRAYLEQFEKDFSLFLRLRSEEIKCQGRMVLTLMGRKGEDPSSPDCCYVWELLAQALNQMVSEGMIEGAKVDSFDIPYYTPSVEELKTVIDMEGSFNLDQLEIFEINWDTNDNDNDDDGYEGGMVYDKFTRGKIVASCVRAVTESLLASHFGEAVMDILFKRYAENVGEHLAKENTKHVNFIFSLTKRD